MLVTKWSLVSSRRSRTASRMSCGTFVVKNFRISSRNSASSADSASCMCFLPRIDAHTLLAGR